jgi:hypothetical protein
MCATVLKVGHTPQTIAFVPVQPAVHGVRIARFQQEVARDGMGRLPISDFQQGGTALAHVRPWVVIARVQQGLTLCVGQV